MLKQEEKKASVFCSLHFYWSFSCDIVAVKGLNNVLAKTFLSKNVYVGVCVWWCVCVGGGGGKRVL